MGNPKQKSKKGKFSYQNKAKIKKLSAKTGAKEGKNIDFAIIDEIHELKDNGLEGFFPCTSDKARKILSLIHRYSPETDRHRLLAFLQGMPALPSEHCFEIIRQGYQDNKIQTDPLYTALINTKGELK